jgi:hypothetical protein
MKTKTMKTIGWDQSIYTSAEKQSSKIGKLLLPRDPTKLLFELQEISQRMLTLVSVSLLHEASTLTQVLLNMQSPLPDTGKSFLAAS